jgi:hypothetical protein
MFMNRLFLAAVSAAALDADSVNLVAVKYSRASVTQR